MGDADQSLLGLIDCCGTLSENHEGQLKRICPVAINLLKFLVALEPIELFEGMEPTNIFYERFVRISVPMLNKINFKLHILSDKETISLLSGGARQVCYLLLFAMFASLLLLWK